MKEVKTALSKTGYEAAQLSIFLKAKTISLKQITAFKNEISSLNECCDQKEIIIYQA